MVPKRPSYSFAFLTEGLTTENSLYLIFSYSFIGSHLHLFPYVSQCQSFKALMILILAVLLVYGLSEAGEMALQKVYKAIWCGSQVVRIGRKAICADTNPHLIILNLALNFELLSFMWSRQTLALPNYSCFVYVLVVFLIGYFICMLVYACIWTALSALIWICVYLDFFLSDSVSISMVNLYFGILMLCCFVCMFFFFNCFISV